MGLSRAESDAGSTGAIGLAMWPEGEEGDAEEEALRTRTNYRASTMLHELESSLPDRQKGQ
jgi:hypothetical protein